MEKVTIHAAKTNLSRLIQRVEAGEEILLARGDQPVAKLVPLSTTPHERKFGALRGKIIVDQSFFEPLPEDELSRWER
jgi:antitoxin (DNA-binding transcriptional repressor) of toxin-antitoxin stability system